MTWDLLKAELRRQADACKGKFSDTDPNLEPQTVRFNGVVDLRFLAGCVEDLFWEELVGKLRRRS
jgi:hypothetical protein